MVLRKYVQLRQHVEDEKDYDAGEHASGSSA
jgi:hypothetical protein